MDGAFLEMAIAEAGVAKTGKNRRQDDGFVLRKKRVLKKALKKAFEK